MEDGYDLECEVRHVLISVIQHVRHAKDGAVGVRLGMVSTFPDIIGRHCGDKVPSERKILHVNDRK